MEKIQVHPDADVRPASVEHPCTECWRAAKGVLVLWVTFVAAAAAAPAVSRYVCLVCCHQRYGLDVERWRRIYRRRYNERVFGALRTAVQRQLLTQHTAPKRFVRDFVDAVDQGRTVHPQLYRAVREYAEREGL